MSKQSPKFEQCRCPDCRAAEEAGTNNADHQPSEATIGNLWRNDVYFDHEYEALRSRYESKD